MKKHRHLLFIILLLLPFFIGKSNLALVTIGGRIETTNQTISFLSTVLWICGFGIWTLTSDKKKETALHITIVLALIYACIMVSGLCGGILTIFLYPFAALTEYITISSITALTAVFIAVPWIIVLFSHFSQKRKKTEKVKED